MSCADVAPNLARNTLQRWWYWVFALQPHTDTARIDHDQRTRMPEPEPVTAAGFGRVDDSLPPPSSLATYAPSIVNVSTLLEQARSAFVGRIRTNLEQDRRDAAETDDAAPSDPAGRACLSLAKLVAPCVALATELKWAAFTEETGAVSLVLQSALMDRRVNFCISANGTNVSCIRIDESMKSAQFDVRLDDANTVEEMARWVAGRA